MRKSIALIPLAMLGIMIAAPAVHAAESCTCPVALVCTETADAEPAVETPNTYPDAVFRLSAVLPAPTDGAAEWIELTNLGGDASLYGWTLDDSEGGSNPHVIENSDLIPAGGTVRLTADVTKLALNNGGDDVRLFSPSGDLVDSLSYGSAKSGIVLMKSGTGWAWANEIGTGEENTEETTTVPDASGPNDETINQDPPNTNPIDAIELTEGQVLITGVVTLPPGGFSQTIFALRADDGQGYLARIYGDGAPALSSGDRIAFPAKLNDTEDDGVMASVTGSNIVWLSSNNDQTVTEVTPSEIGEALHGQIVSVSGTVSATGSTWLNLTSDDLSSEVKVDVSPDAAPMLEPGTKVYVTGVVRWQNDVAVIKSALGQISLMPSSDNDGNQPDNAAELNDAGEPDEIIETKTIEIQPSNSENGTLSSIAISLSGLGATILAVWKKKSL